VKQVFAVTALRPGDCSEGRCQDPGAVQGPGRRSRVQPTVSTGPIRCPIYRLRGMGCHRLWRHCRPRVARSVMTSRDGKLPQEETAPMGYSPLLRRALRFDWSGRWDGHQQAWIVANRSAPAGQQRPRRRAPRPRAWPPSAWVVDRAGMIDGPVSASEHVQGGKCAGSRDPGGSGGRTRIRAGPGCPSRRGFGWFGDGS
jgi:hypothetical protein